MECRWEGCSEMAHTPKNKKIVPVWVDACDLATIVSCKCDDFSITMAFIYMYIYIASCSSGPNSPLE